MIDQRNGLIMYNCPVIEQDIAKYLKRFHYNFRYNYFRGFNKNYDRFKFNMLPNLNFFFSHRRLSSKFTFDKAFGCNHQLSNQINGYNEFSSKTHTCNYYSAYMKTKDPTCVDKFMPEQYLLQNKVECESFFKYLNSSEYLKEKEEKYFVFLKKIGINAHAGTGVFLFDQKEEELLKETYENGTKCGNITRQLQMQRYISNPPLINGRKFDFRSYILIASTNPLIVYQHDGYLTLSIDKYDPNSKDRSVHLTNTHVSSEASKERNEEITLLENPYTLLQDELLKTGRISDPNWIDNYLRPQIMKIMIHVSQMTKHKFVKRSNWFQMLGMDFMLDENLKVWFIEGNTTPGFDPETRDLQKTIFKDLIEVQFAYLRSRMKRIVIFLNKLSDQIPDHRYIDYESGKYPLKEFDTHQAEFETINKNYIEPEYQISQENTWRKIVDENEKGVERYSGLITENCLNNVMMNI